MSAPERGFAAHLRALVARTSFARAFLLAFTVIAAWHADCVTDPPYWDALMGAFAQAHWHATHSYSPFDLMRDAAFFTEGGACTYPFSVYPSFVGAFESAGVAPGPTFVVLHLLSFAAAAAIVAGTFELLRREIAPWLAALAAAAILCQPTVRALACQMNMDVLLGACTILALLAVARDRVGAACAWSLAAVLVKPTGIIVVVAVAATWVARALWPGSWTRNAGGAHDVGATAADGGRRARFLGAAFLLVVFVAFVLELVALARFGRSQPGVALFGGVVQLLGKRLWTLPEFGLALAAVGCAFPFLVARVVRGRGTPVLVVSTVFVAAFTGFYFQYSNVLPRYFVQAWPAVVGLLVLFALGRGVRAPIVAAGLVGFAALGLVNARGRLHPVKFADWSAPGESQPLATNDGWLLERSLAYRDDLELEREIVARVARRGVRVVANWPVLQMVSVPRLGYVDAPLPAAAAGVTLEYASVAVPYHGHLDPTEERVWVLSPNVYDNDHSRFRAGDEVLETVRRGDRRAFLVRRSPASSSPRR